MTSEQQKALLEDLHPSRVAMRKGGSGRALSYVEAWDVKRTLIRIFGFGGFSAEVTDNQFRWESVTVKKVKEKQDDKWVEVEKELWEVAYQATVRLTIHDPEAVYTESAVGSAMGSRAEAHDNAIKNAASDALKRAAIYLGTQFGLSLYNNGATQDVVRRTLTGEGDKQITPEDVSYWKARFADSADRSELSEQWKQCMKTGLEKIPYQASGRTLLDDVNDRLSDFEES